MIYNPQTGLKIILGSLNHLFQSVYKPDFNITGFVKNRSIIDNAKIHLQKDFVYNIDIKDFFYSFSSEQVVQMLFLEPFCFNEKRKWLAYLISGLCTHPININNQIKNTLPQGSPASPILTNLLCIELDKKLDLLAKDNNADYSRYADDITFSCNKNIFTNDEFLCQLNRIIEEEEKLKINKDKTRLQKNGYRKEVTGIVVNEKLNVTRLYIKSIRMYLYYWEKYGYAKAERKLKKDYMKDRRHIPNAERIMEKILLGKLNFLKMVKGEDNQTYLKLRLRFNRLSK
jgi:hypothetical protein